MPKLNVARTAQYPLVKDFTFSFDNFVVDSVDLTKKTLGSTVAASTDPNEPGLLGPLANTVVFDAIPLPPGAVIIGGEVIVDSAYVLPATGVATVSLGIAGSTTALAAAVTLQTVGRTALALTTPLVSNSGQNLRATIAYTVGNATAGKARLRVQYTVDGRSQEIQVA